MRAKNLVKVWLFGKRKETKFPSAPPALRAKQLRLAVEEGISRVGESAIRKPATRESQH
jgi:hypothetical protein